MEKNSLVILLLIIFPLCLNAQGRKKSFVQKDMFAVSAGLGGGILVAHPIQDVYVNGCVEYFMEKRISVKTDVFAFIPDFHFEGQLQKNSSLFIGVAYHFPFMRWDPYIALQPGIAFPGLSSGNTAEKVKSGIEPMLAMNFGVNYYIGHNFHAYVAGGYAHGNYYPELTNNSFLLDELRLMAGIGCNVFFNRYAPYERRRVRF